MAKGQVRSNREVRKPKKEKTVAPAAPLIGEQVRLASSDAMKSGKKKRG